MASDDSIGSPPRGQTRVPIDAEVQLEFENFSGFIREVSANLSLGGMFVKTRYLKPVGTIVRFEFRLSDHYRLIRGSGEVVWTRWRDQPPAMPAGMGIQFVDLDAESRSLVNAIVEQHERAGGSPFDLESHAGLEGAARPASENLAFAPAVPASGSGVSSKEVSDWLRAESGGATPESGGAAPWPADEPPRMNAEIFMPPAPAVGAPGDRPAQTQGELPPAGELHEPPLGEPPLDVAFDEPSAVPAPVETLPPPTPDDTTSWGFAPRQAAGQSRPLDWGAAEAMAALGIATSTPLAPNEALPPRDIPAIPSTRMPPPPRFGGGQAARSDEGSRRVLLTVAAVAVAVFALGGWWIFRGRQAGPATPLKPSKPPATAPAAPSAAAPATAPSAPPSATTPSPGPAVATPAASSAVSPTSAPVANAGPAPVSVSPPAPAAIAPAPPSSAPASPAATVARFTALQTITWRSSGGETEVILTTNGAAAPGDVERVRLEKPEPRELIKVKGVRQAFNPTRLDAKTPELRQIRIGFHEDGAQGQLHVVLDLASPDVRVVSVQADGRLLRVRLGRS